MQLRTKQFIIFYGLCIATVICTVIVFFTFNQKDLVFSEGKMLFDHGNLNRAEELVRKSIMMGLHTSRAYLTLADIYIAEGNYTGALFWNKQALKIRPDNTKALGQQATLLLLMKNNQQTNIE